MNREDLYPLFFVSLGLGVILACALVAAIFAVAWWWPMDRHDD